MGNMTSHGKSAVVGGQEVSVSTPKGSGGNDEGDRGLLRTKNFMALLDPRSPTIGVSRTPVEVVAERERAKERTRKIQPLSGGTGNTNLLTAEVHTPSAFIDPRSPAYEYKRTPIAFDEVGDKDEEGSTPGNIKYASYIGPQIPTSATPLSRELRKRLFVSQIEGVNGSETMQEGEDKEN